VQLVAGLGLSLLGHLGRVRWLAKDVVWVVPDRACGGVEATQAWADTYASQVGGLVGGWEGGVRSRRLWKEGGSMGSGVRAATVWHLYSACMHHAIQVSHLPYCHVRLTLSLHFVVCLCRRG
jgi:hypothetical protein